MDFQYYNRRTKQSVFFSLVIVKGRLCIERFYWASPEDEKGVATYLSIATLPKHIKRLERGGFKLQSQ